tara:strand:+ start:1263 stop:2219 length:957 start_codon:yes stop_codon:yes gene_type:complete
MERIIYLHPGYPKTGTSFLQRTFFVHHPKINNLGKKNNHASVSKDLLETFHKIMHFEKLSEDDYKNCLKTITAIDYKENMTNLISFEGLTQLNFKVNQDVIFKRLKNLFTDCNFQLKVFITIRNQLSILPSHYANTPTIYIDRGSKFCKSFKSFINNINRIDKFYEKNIINAYDRYKYFQLLQLIIDIFSEKNVKIFLLEDCEKDSNAFFNEICLFMKIENYHEIKSRFPVNVTRKKGKEFKRINKYFFSQNRILYYFSKLLPKPLKEIIANFFIDLKNYRDPIILDKVQQDTIINYYREDNELLAEYLNKDLKSLGF